MPSALNSATKAQQIAADPQGAGTSDAFVTPLRQYIHPSACKAWIEINMNGTNPSSYNCGVVTDTGPGQASIALVAAFLSTNFCAVLGLEYTSNNTAAGTLVCLVENVASGNSVQVSCMRLSDYAYTDPNHMHLSCFGVQA